MPLIRSMGPHSESPLHTHTNPYPLHLAILFSYQSYNTTYLYSPPALQFFCCCTVLLAFYSTAAIKFC